MYGDVQKTGQKDRTIRGPTLYRNRHRHCISRRICTGVDFLNKIDDEKSEQTAIIAMTAGGALAGWMLGTFANKTIEAIEDYEPWWVTAKKKVEDLIK